MESLRCLYSGPLPLIRQPITGAAYLDKKQNEKKENRTKETWSRQSFKTMCFTRNKYYSAAKHGEIDTACVVEVYVKGCLPIAHNVTFHGQDKQTGMGKSSCTARKEH